MDRQQTLDFNRAERQAMIGSCRLPRNLGVSAPLLKLVLARIEDRGRVCCVSQETLAAECGCSLRQLKRAVDVLRGLSLVTIERRMTPYGVVTNHYGVVWSELSLLCADRTAPGATSRTGQPASAVPFSPSKVPTAPTKVPNVAYQSATHGTQTIEPQKPPQPGPDPGQAAAGLDGFGQLRKAGVSEYKARQLSREHSPELIRQVCTEFALNRRLLDGPGAIVRRLDCGCWPVDGVRSLADIAAARQAAAARIAAQQAAYDPPPADPADDSEPFSAVAMFRQAIAEKLARANVAKDRRADEEVTKCSKGAIDGKTSG